MRCVFIIIIIIMSYTLEFPLLSSAQKVHGIDALWQRLLHISPLDDQHIKEFAHEVFCEASALKRASSHEVKEALEHLLCMVAYMRDIHDGLGYRKLTYHCVLSLYQCCPDWGEMAVQHILFDEHIGCWRDGPGLCDVLPSHDHPLAVLVVALMNDALAQNKGTVAKWIPRETSKKHKWLFEKLAIDWCCKHEHYCPSSYPALRKCFMTYRKRVASMSSTYAEQKLCGHRCGDLDVARDVTQSNLAKHWHCFFAQTPMLERRSNVSCDRELFALSLTRSLGNRVCVGEKHVVGTTFFPANMKVYVSLARQCMLLVEEMPPNIGREIESLNSLMGRLFANWRNKVGDMSWALPVIDVNVYSLEDPVLHRAIGHALFIARHSGVRRILFSAHRPLWISLDDRDGGFFRDVRAIFDRLEGEIILNTGKVEQALSVLGSAHPFFLHVISQNGHCEQWGVDANPFEKHIQPYREKYDSLIRSI